MCRGYTIKDIAAKLEERPNTIILWRDRFIKNGINGLYDQHRSGKPITYGDEFRSSVLNKLSEKPPNGLANWDRPTLAKELNMSVDAIWRLLKKEGSCASPLKNILVLITKQLNRLYGKNVK